MGSPTQGVEKQLAGGIFGNGPSLKKNSDTYYSGLVGVFSELFPDFGRFADAPRTPQEKSVVRGHLDEAFIYLRTDQERASAKMDELVRLLRTSSPEKPGQPVPPNSSTAGDPPSTGMERPPTLAGWNNPVGHYLQDRFNAAMSHDGLDVAVELREPDEEREAAVDESYRVLAGCLPEIGPSTAAMVDGIALFRGKPHSAYITGTPVVVYVNEDWITDALHGADSLLHETLHQKLVDFGLTRRMLRSGYLDADSSRAPVPWGGTGRTFSADRTLAAYHVYVHLTLLHCAALQHGDALGLPHSDDEVEARTAVRWARARYLGSRFDDPAMDRELDVDGRALVSWLWRANEELGTLALPSGRILATYDQAHGG
ncbi:hypothetical protein [Streptomyces sp. NPDC058045]|uniref:hypothetical protein n=1 Tax=Streptomyces sp. NPDC058045 TaxID=3346311 RepID=UPI0036EE6778